MSRQARPQAPQLPHDELRLAAEQAVAARVPAGGRRSAGGASAAQAPGDSDALRHWHELQVSQIELDLQNQALDAIQSERDRAEAGRYSYAALYDQAPAGYLSLDADGAITRANHAAGELLGHRREALVGKRFEQFVAPLAQAGLRRFLAELQQHGRRSVLELPLFEASPHDGPRQVRMEANLDSVSRLCRVILTDIGSPGARESARQRAFQLLDHMEEGVIVCDAQVRIVSVNRAFTTLTGYPVEEVLGRNPSFLDLAQAHPPGFQAGLLERLRVEGRWQGEVHHRRRDGSRYVASVSLTVIRSEGGAISQYIGVFSDDTARQQAEAELLALSRALDARVAERTAALTETNRLLTLEVAERERTEAALRASREELRKLAHHLETVKEEERKRIARDIHDELGQNLLALRIDMSMLAARTAGSHPRLHGRVQAALGQLDTTVRSVRGIMNELRPAVLDLGLLAALEWQAGEFRKRSGLACTLTLPPDGALAGIGPELEIVLFRCLQEALSNVRRHAHASHVAVALAVDGGRLALTVADNGVGLSPQERARSESFGLIGMAQRVQALGGTMTLSPYVAGGGCSLTLGFALA